MTALLTQFVNLLGAVLLILAFATRLLALARGIDSVHHLLNGIAGGVLPGHFHQFRVAHEI